MKEAAEGSTEHPPVKIFCEDPPTKPPPALPPQPGREPENRHHPLTPLPPGPLRKPATRTPPKPTNVIICSRLLSAVEWLISRRKRSPLWLPTNGASRQAPLSKPPRP